RSRRQTSAPDRSRARSSASDLRCTACAPGLAFICVNPRLRFRVNPWLRFNLWIRVLQLRQITRARLRVQLAQQRITTIAVLQLRHAAVRIVDVSENDRLRRTNCLTRRDNVAVSQLAILELRLNLSTLNALHAVSALLHHTATTH